jgi:hypothetical protein
MMAMFTMIALSEFNIPESIATPCSVKQMGHALNVALVLGAQFVTLKSDALSA